MARHSVYDIFTPTTQATLNYVDRAHLERPLKDALKTPGKQVVVYGESGSGKSTLLRNKLTETYAGHITTRCSAASTFSTVLLDAFDQLDPYYVDSRTREQASRVKGSLSAQFIALKTSLQAQMSETSGQGNRRVLPPQLTPQRLGEFMGAQELCWVLEDFHKVPKDEKTPIAQTLKIFSDLAANYPRLRIIAIGATDTARDVVHYDREMSNRIAEINVPLMSEDELRTMVANGARLLNVQAAVLTRDIVLFSTGQASVAHHLALNACIAAGVEETGRKQVSLATGHLDLAVKQYVSESSDTLKSLFDAALKRKRERTYDNTRLILAALASGPLEGMTHAQIRANIREEHPKYPAGNVTSYLRALTTTERGGLVRQTTGGAYRFSEPIYHSYAQALLGTTHPGHTWSPHLEEVFVESVKDVIVKWDLFEGSRRFEMKVHRLPSRQNERRSGREEQLDQE